MTVALITGALGFAGQYLVKELAQSSMVVVGLAQHPPMDELSEGMADCYVRNLLDLNSFHAIINKIRSAFVVHLAAVSFVAHSDVDEMYSVIFWVRVIC